MFETKEKPRPETADDRRRAWWREQVRHDWRSRPRQDNTRVYDPFAPKPPPSNSKTREAQDKVYTTEWTARFCHDAVRPYLPAHAVLFDPAAGSGVFISTCPEKRTIFGIEAYPDTHGRPDLIRRDFLQIKEDIRRFVPETMRERSLFAIGNPPFGYRQRLSIAFINACLAHPTVEGVAFVLGRSMRAFRQQDQINKDARLVLDVDLPDDAVHMRGADPQVRTCFQVWIKGRTRHRGWQDQRIVGAPPSRHPDFTMRPYSIQSRGPQPEGWRFAVSRTGECITIAEPGRHLDRALKWITVSTDDAAVEARLRAIDFNALAKRRTVGTPGYGMSDIVAAYEEATAAG